MEFEYVLDDQMSAALKRIDAAAKPLPKDLKAVEDEINKLDRLERSNSIKKIEDPMKKRHELLKLQRDDLKKNVEAQKAYQRASEDAAKNSASAMNGLLEGLGATAALGAAAAVAIGGLATQIAKAAVNAAELHKQSVRKISFGLGKPGDMKAAEDELAIVKKIRDVSTADESTVVENFRSVSAAGFDKTSAENILTLAEDARAAGDQAADAVLDAYKSLRKSQNDQVNMGRGAFDKATFEKLAESGAIDRNDALAAIAKKYKTSNAQAERMLQSNMVTADIGQDILTDQLRKRHDNGGAIGSGAQARADDSLDVQANRVKSRMSDILAHVNDKPIIDFLKKVGDLLDPENPRIKRFSDLISKTFEYVGNFIDRISGGNTGATLGGLFDKIADRADAFFRVFDKLGDAWDNKISPALDRMMKALAPLLKDLGLTKDTFKNTEDVDAFGDSLDAIATIAVKVIDSISDTVKTIDNLVKSIKEAVDWAGRMKDALASAPSTAVTTAKATTKNIVDKALSYLPGFQIGLERVPFDNFPARLHKDERVLTAAEAKAYDQRSLAPAPPMLDLRGGFGGRGGFQGNLSVNVTVNAAGAAASDPVALGQQVSDEVQSQLIEFLETLGYQTGAMAS